MNLGVPFGKNSKYFFVDPANGADGNKGTDISKPLATLEKALELATANSNDVVVLIGTTNAATPTTYRVPAGGLDWNKDAVHLIGICSGNHTQQRARISTATTDVTTEIPLTISADNCMFANFSVFHGVDGTTLTNPSAVKVTGQRNAFNNVTMSGLGDATSTNTMDVNDGASLWLASSENTFRNCYLGLETVYLGNTTAAAIRITGATSRNLFEDCIISTRASHVGHASIVVGASGLQDMGAYFRRCTFTNSGIFAGGTASDEVFDVHATQNGGIVVDQCGAVGFSFWEKATVSDKVYVVNPAVGAGKAGLATVAVGS
ncbi:MAG: hypothetical protein ACXWYM_00335 [Candidatus Binatia bacterium]